MHITPTTTSRSRSRLRGRLLGLLIGVVLIVTACGSGDVPIVEAAPAAADAATEAVSEAPAPEAAGGVAATIGDSELGQLIAGADGRSLYAFTNDVDAISTCNGTCAEAWPPVIVDADFAVAPGLDVGIFATAPREDGSLQLVAGRFPLYFFAGDANPGDLAGQGSGDVWFAVGLDGELLTGEAAEGEDAAEAETTESAVPVAVAVTDLGEILVDADGLSLYGFTEDVDGLPTCADACADAWPPALTDSSALPEGLDPEIFSVVEGPDGTFQLKAGIWPLYRFAGDGAPGDINGQESGDVWFLATPTGGLIRGDDAVTEDAAGAEAPAEEAAGEGADYDY